MDIKNFINKLNSIENPKTIKERNEFLSNKSVERKQELDKIYEEKQRKILIKLKNNIDSLTTKKLLEEVNNMNMVMKELKK